MFFSSRFGRDGLECMLCNRPAYNAPAIVIQAITEIAAIPANTKKTGCVLFVLRCSTM